MNITREEIELMAPVGSFESLMAAIHAGADAVYFGAGNLNMRAASTVNFSFNDIAKIAEICRNHNVKTYLTLNTVIYDDDYEEIQKIVDCAHENQIDAVIASDISVMNYAKQCNMNVHGSTQINITNSMAVQHLAAWADVIVLARELNLKQVRVIYDYINTHNIKGPKGNLVKLEMFIHGALCMAVSGKCYLSLHQHNKSANRGECLQPCRREYSVEAHYLAAECEQKYQLEIANQHIMSPKDLCTISFLDKILEAGARVLKIEGRGRSPEYVKRVVECYNTALEHIIAGTYNDALINNLTERLKEVFNRGFWDGYYLGQTMGEWSERHSSSATHKKEFIGIGTNYFSNLGVGEFLVQTGQVNIGDNLLVVGPTTGVLEVTVSELHNDNGAVQNAGKGERFAVAVPQKIRKNDKIYKLIEVNNTLIS